MALAGLGCMARLRQCTWLLKDLATREPRRPLVYVTLLASLRWVSGQGPRLPRAGNLLNVNGSRHTAEPLFLRALVGLLSICGPLHSHALALKDL